MKAVLGLALLCCFVVGSLGVACKPELQCRLFKECACDNKVGKIMYFLKEDLTRVLMFY